MVWFERKCDNAQTMLMSYYVQSGSQSRGRIEARYELVWSIGIL